MKIKSPWLVHGARRECARLRLLCFPYAGAGASTFRNWADLLPSEVDVIAVQPPGREGRFREQLPTNLREMAVSLVDALAPHLDLPLATFGHSLGTLLSYETALELRRRSMPLPSHMIMSGRGAPHQHVESYRKNYRLLPRAIFIEELRNMQGTPEEVLDSDELMTILLPILRADFALNATYDVGNDLPLSCRMTVYGGLNDIDTSEAQLQEWRRYTTGGFTHRMFEDGHFFVNSMQSQVLHWLVHDLGLQRAPADSNPPSNLGVEPVGLKS
jgi:medium-chain acyl-[acyl-carrier-protein] hydrolase